MVIRIQTKREVTSHHCLLNDSQRLLTWFEMILVDLTAKKLTERHAGQVSAQISGGKNRS